MSKKNPKYAGQAIGKNFDSRNQAMAALLKAADSIKKDNPERRLTGFVAPKGVMDNKSLENKEQQSNNNNSGKYDAAITALDVESRQQAIRETLTMVKEMKEVNPNINVKASVLKQSELGKKQNIPLENLNKLRR